MALINCPECEKKVSDQAKECIGCGYPLREEVAQGNQQVEDKTDIKLECPVEIKGDEVLKKTRWRVCCNNWNYYFCYWNFYLICSRNTFYWFCYNNTYICPVFLH